MITKIFFHLVSKKKVSDLTRDFQNVLKHFSYSALHDVH